MSISAVAQKKTRAGLDYSDHRVQSHRRAFSNKLITAVASLTGRSGGGAGALGSSSQGGAKTPSPKYSMVNNHKMNATEFAE